jgi:hypothetical protein
MKSGFTRWVARRHSTNLPKKDPRKTFQEGHLEKGRSCRFAAGTGGRIVGLPGECRTIKRINFNTAASIGAKAKEESKFTADERITISAFRGALQRPLRLKSHHRSRSSRLRWLACDSGMEVASRPFVKKFWIKKQWRFACIKNS